MKDAETKDTDYRGVMRMAGVLLHLLVLKTRQVDKLRAFYRALGVELAEERHGKGPLHYAGRVGETVLEVYPLSEDAGAADSTTRLGFAVGDVDAVRRSLIRRGKPPGVIARWCEILTAAPWNSVGMKERSRGKEICGERPA